MKLLIIDTGPLTYNGFTLFSRGLGGSEAAIILLASELAKIDFDVTVLNSCKTDSISPGKYHDVTYIDHSDINLLTNYDIVISSRSVLPFLPDKNNPYNSIIKNSYKVVWLHDTFCTGDEFLEELLNKNYIDEIFTLSDFHTNYVLNADHGNRRMYEILKNKTFQTRNGAVKYKSADISKKDKNAFVYNSAVSKGLVPLLDDIWPIIKQKIPNAYLHVIGGYYALSSGELDDQGILMQKLMNDDKYKKLNVIFTGIVTQKIVANILSNASYMIYPAQFPETFGISVLESMLYNTPVITCRFGALESTAIEKSCYLLDYPIEPNGLFTNVNKQDQVNRFVQLVMRAYDDEYLYQQKQQHCSIIETDEIYSWESIALQWKQHLYYKLGHYLPLEEYRKVIKINDSVNRIFGIKFNNTEQLETYRNYCYKEKPIKIITPVYNAEKYIKRCIDSVITQNYNNYVMYIIDDNSSDGTNDIISSYEDDRIVLITNKENKGALYNQYHAINEFCFNNDIIMLLDGDDCLVNNNTIFTYYNNIHEDYDFTYGSCFSEIDEIPLIAQEYPEEVENYRDHQFTWGIPYTHLRTFKKQLINNIDIDNLMNDNGWIKAGGDNPFFYELISKADKNRIKAVKEIMVLYNDKNPINDYKVNSTEQTINATKSIGKEIDIKSEKFSIIIPTMWKYEPFCRFLEQLVTVDLIDEIIIINNDSKNTPINDVLNNEKIKLCNFSKNIFVNPAWNYGVSISNNNKLGIINDDIEYNTNIFEKVYEYVTPDNGAIGIIFDDYTNNNITIEPYISGNLYGFGSLFFLHKDNWVDIPNELKVEYGDTMILDRDIKNNKQLYLIKDIHFFTPCATTRAFIDSGEIYYPELKSEKIIYDNLMNGNKNEPKPNNNKLEIFFHVYVPDHVNINSLWWIDEELLAIENSNLKENANINLCITINKTFTIPVPKKIVLKSIIDHISSKYNYVTVLDIRDTSEENIYEQQTLNYVYEFSINNPNKKVLYIHTKGISVFSESQKEWLSILNKSLIHDWKNCIKQLETNDVVGLNDLSLANKPIIVSGNFFWANTNYIATLPNPKDTHEYSKNNNRYDYELWITSKKPKISFVYNTETNHYLEIFQDKKILIAIPTDKYISPETFKSIYDLNIPHGYKTHFQYFYGYRIDQVRNLIANWAKDYDYLFSVDSDIVLPNDTLEKLLRADKDIVSGLYVQRNDDNVLEIFTNTKDRRIKYEEIKDKELYEVEGVGFGCVLIKSDVIRNISYPHFLYKHALDHNNTYSEDVYFCDKARELNYKIFVDTTILCDHIGTKEYKVR